MPSNPYDAKGLLIASIEDDDPVIFLEPKRIYNGPFDGHHDGPCRAVDASTRSAKCPTATTPCELGKAAIRREGDDVTVLAYGTMVHVAEAAANETGIDAEIIDLRTLLPLDIDTIDGVGAQDRPMRHRARGHADVGFGAELAATVQERCFYQLEAPIERVTGWDTPYPHAQEWDYFPGPTRVGRALRRVMEA